MAFADSSTILDVLDQDVTWQQVLRPILPDSLWSGVADYLQFGTAPIQSTQIGMEHYRHSLSIMAHPRSYAQSIMLMPKDVLQRFWQLATAVHPESLIELATTGSMLYQRVELEEKFTLADLVAIAPHIELLDDIHEKLLQRNGLHLANSPELGDYLADHMGYLQSRLTPPKSDHEYLWKTLIPAIPEDQLNDLAECAVDAAVAGSKRLRSAVNGVLHRFDPAKLISEARERCVSTPDRKSTPAQRTHAIGLVDRLTMAEDRPAFVEWLNTELAADRSAAVRDAIAEISSRAHRPEIEVPILPTLEPIPDLYPDRPRLHRVVNFVVGRLDSANQSVAVNSSAATDHYDAYLFLKKVDSGEHVQLEKGHIARLLMVSAGRWDSGTSQLIEKFGIDDPLFFNAVAELDDAPQIRVIGAVTHAVAEDPNLWGPAALERWVSYNEQQIVDALGAPDHVVSRPALFELAVSAGSHSVAIEEALVAAVIGGPKRDRQHLWHCVADGRFVHRIAAGLSSRKKGERLAAAEFFKQHSSNDAVEPLRIAARKEGDERIKATMLAALEMAGQDVDEFVGADALLADATKAMAKKNAIPKAMQWLSLDSLPELRWLDGTNVDRVIINWFLVSAVKQKTAEPSPILRRHFANMDRATVERFGGTILDLWMAHDLGPIPEAEARSRALQQAQYAFNHVQNTPASHLGGWGARFAGLSLDQIAEILYQELHRTIIGSATPSKGLLAITAAASGAEVTDRALAYIKKHRGHRLSQSKALIQMLAWIDEPATVQAVMSIATRFRPKALQKEAETQAQLLADRHGWTLDDLADRSVPDGGFDGDARQVIDFGTRTFTARLTDDLTVTLTNDETGKTVRSLPKGRADEDEEVIKEAKKDFSRSEERNQERSHTAARSAANGDGAATQLERR